MSHTVRRIITTRGFRIQSPDGGGDLAGDLAVGGGEQHSSGVSRGMS